MCFCHFAIAFIPLSSWFSVLLKAAFWASELVVAKPSANCESSFLAALMDSPKLLLKWNCPFLRNWYDDLLNLEASSCEVRCCACVTSFLSSVSFPSTSCLKLVMASIKALYLSSSIVVVIAKTTQLANLYNTWCRMTQKPFHSLYIPMCHVMHMIHTMYSYGSLFSV